MENITSIASNVGVGVISSLLTLIIVSIFNKLKETKKQVPNTNKPAIKERIGLWARYITMLVVLALIVAFVSLNKFFVVLIALVFSIVAVMLVFDYSMSILNTLVSDKQTERLQSKKRMDEVKLKQLIRSIEQSDDKEKRQLLKLELDELLFNKPANSIN